MRSNEQIRRYKMYKTRRGWLVAGITVSSLGFMLTLPNREITAQASESATVSQISSAAADPANTATLSAPKQPSANTTVKEAVQPAETTTKPATSTSNLSTETAPVNSGEVTETAPQSVESPVTETPDTTEQPTEDTTKAITEATTDAPLVDTPAAAEHPGATEPTTVPNDASADEQAPIITDKTSTTANPEAASATEVPAETSDPIAETTTPEVAPIMRAAANAEPVTDAVNASANSAQTGVVIKDPNDLTDNITGQSKFNIPKGTQLQYTFEHTDANGVSSDLRVVDDYKAEYQTQGAGVWRGLSYANSIALDAKGADPNYVYSDGSHPFYIDEWMPDYAFQTFLWQTSFDKKYATINDFRANFTKAELATVTSISSSDSKQTTGSNYAPTQYYYALMAMKTLEGLQNATALKSIYIFPNIMVSQQVFGSAMKNGNLWDIRALAPLQNLERVSISLTSINDISALSNKETLRNVDLPYNQITDISPLATNPNLNVSQVSLSNQHVLLSPITLNTKLEAGKNAAEGGVYTYTTPSFIIKDLVANNLPVQGFDNVPGSLYPSLYPSSSDAGNVNANTLTWYNLLADSSTRYGTMSTVWSDTNTSFAGYVIQPYALSVNASEVVVNIELIQPNGEQLTLAPATVVSGEVGDVVTILSNPTVESLLQQQYSKGYKLDLTLDGTGRYSDYLAGNGLANIISDWKTATLTEATQNLTIIFGLPWQLTATYGTKDADGNFTAILEETDVVVDALAHDEVSLNDFSRDLPDYVFVGVETSDGHTWTDVTGAELIPFLTANQTVRFIYQNAYQATVNFYDATTETVLSELDYQTYPELRGAVGTTSTFDATTLIQAYLDQGYVLLENETVDANGNGAIIFDAAGKAYRIKLAHHFDVETQTVIEDVTYVDLNGRSMSTPKQQTAQFGTTTDAVTGDQVSYVSFSTHPFELNEVTGQPDLDSWDVYTDPVSFSAIVHPEIQGAHVLAVEDAAGQSIPVTTQIAEQLVSPTTADLAFTVTYAHDFNTTAKTVTQTIHYRDLADQEVSSDHQQGVTFLTVTDLYNNEVTYYFTNEVGATVPELNDNGQPADKAWNPYQLEDVVALDAVINPTVANTHVIETTDPANDLTQVTAKSVSLDSTDLEFIVTYAHDFEMNTKSVKETIQYIDLDKNIVSPEHEQGVTFLTVTDLYNAEITYYVANGINVAEPELNDNGQPTGEDWTAYQLEDVVALDAVINPTVANTHVIKTTDPANDLTQVTAKSVSLDSTDLEFIVTYAHDFDVKTKSVKQTIQYRDLDKNIVSPDHEQGVTFLTVTDLYNAEITYYVANGINVAEPELNDNGQPTGEAWTAYQDGSAIELAAIANPTVNNARVIETTDPANDLTQVTAQSIKLDSSDLDFIVTYAHDFEMNTKSVKQTIQYRDLDKNIVSPDHEQGVTFLTVTNLYNNEVTYYFTNEVGATAPELNDNGQPADKAWKPYQLEDVVALDAVINPTVANTHVIKTTDPANDLTQVTAQSIKLDSADLEFIVTYAHDFEMNTKSVKETIRYIDLDKNIVSPDHEQGVTFLTVTDLYNDEATYYFTNGIDVAEPELNNDGQPTGQEWQRYQDGSAIELAAIAHPQVTNVHVISTDDPASDLTQIVGKTITRQTEHLDFVVTYAHDFDVKTKSVKQTIQYHDLDNNIISPDHKQGVTFLTVTDLYNGKITYYVTNAIDAAAPELNNNGQPIDEAWVTHPADETIILAAVANPTVNNARVIETTDPAKDLTQVTAQSIKLDSTDLDFIVTYAHDFNVKTKSVKQTIQYHDLENNIISPDYKQGATFLTVTDLYNNEVTYYVTNAIDTAEPELNNSGQPTGDAWKTYQAGDTVEMNAVINPTLANAHVIKTTDPANDLTQITAQSIKLDSPDLDFIVTYAHDFEMNTKSVKQTIQYIDLNGKRVSPDYHQGVTFLTVTDLYNNEVTYYVTDSIDAVEPELNDNGRPTDEAWVTHRADETIVLAAVANPMVDNAHVIETTDPANDLTQVTAKSIKLDSADLEFIVTYAHDFKTQLNTVNQTINYQQLDKSIAAQPHRSAYTFALVTDTYNQTTARYVINQATTSLALDNHGKPLADDWRAYDLNDALTFDEVAHPVITGAHVLSVVDTQGNVIDAPTALAAQPVDPQTADTTITVTYAHDFTVAAKTVAETIQYRDLAGDQLAAYQRQGVTFITVTDQFNGVKTYYVADGMDVTPPELDDYGQPTTANWQSHQLDGSVELAAVAHPVISGAHVIATTDPSGDLTQTPAQTVSLQTPPFTVTVTYAHDFNVATHTVRETVNYRDLDGHVVAPAHHQGLTFATVTDQYNQNVSYYVIDGIDMAAPELDQQGQLVTADWQAYLAGATLELGAVTHPLLPGRAVLKTSDPSGSLTQIPVQQVTSTSTDLAFTVTYQHLFTTTVKPVTMTINYRDGHGNPMAADSVRTLTFATVTDQATNQALTYVYAGLAGEPALDETGQPQDVSWQLVADDGAQFEAVVHPHVNGAVVQATSDPAGDLTQLSAQPVTATSGDLAFTVTYAHEFETALKHLTQTIHYRGLDGRQVAPAHQQVITFATITDKYNQLVSEYAARGRVEAPVLNEFGRPLDAQWQSSELDALLQFMPVLHPTVTGAYVYASDEPGNDLTQLPAQLADSTMAAKTFNVTYAYHFDVQTRPVTETIHYRNLDGTPIAADHQQTVTFATVTNQYDQTVTHYVANGAVAAPILDANGRPDKQWRTADAAELAAVTNPVIAGTHVVATDDAAGDLTQVTAQLVTPTSADLTFTVSYAHDYQVETRVLTQTINYRDLAGQQLADAHQQTITFATVTDQFNQNVHQYAAFGTVAAPQLNELGRPTDPQWRDLELDDLLQFAPVAHPTIKGATVHATDDPDNDLTQITAKPVTPTTLDRAFNVDYAYD